MVNDNFIINFSPFFSPFFYQGTISRPQSYDLVIGVLSARGNHEQRQAIRDTWLGHVLKISFLQERYAVASKIQLRPHKMCLIHQSQFGFL